MKLAIVTPTGGRPEAMALCARWMSQQTFLRLNEREVDWEWIVIDDVAKIDRVPGYFSELFPWYDSSSSERPTNIFIREPSWQPGQNTQKVNLETALNCLTYNELDPAILEAEAIAFIEDDDWYAPNYLEDMVAKLDEGYDIVGEANARYYHVPTGRRRQLQNVEHASLCQTVIRAELLPLFRKALDSNERYFDIVLWQLVTKHKLRRFLFPESERCVGIKGLPGREGIGNGHAPNSHWKEDTTGSFLQSWVGAEAAKFYEPFRMKFS